jgi:hypothetical protein
MSGKYQNKKTRMSSDGVSVVFRGLLCHFLRRLRGVSKGVLTVNLVLGVKATLSAWCGSKHRRKISKINYVNESLLMYVCNANMRPHRCMWSHNSLTPSHLARLL